VAFEAAGTLLEREHELTELGRALTAAQHGRGRVVLVQAAAGLGKTSLLGVASESAAGMGFVCCRARASELERDFAYGCVRQLLEPAVARIPGPERHRLFEGAAALARPLFAPAAALSAFPLADTSFPMLHGLYWLINNLAAERPVLLSVDDLHWSDAESLRLFAYLAPRLDGLPLAVLASTRPEEGGAGDLARLAAAPETMTLRPGPLSAEATATLCGRALGEVAPEFAASCHEATGGNPLFLEALLREVTEEGLPADSRAVGRVRRIGPASVADAVLLRLSAAPAATTALVRAIAVLGDGASLAEAAPLAGLSEEEATRAADLLARLAILKPAGGLEFTHPIVREAVYADLGVHERARAHARAAGILAQAGVSEERIAAQIAGSEPGGVPGRVELLRRVAADALRRGAPAAAAAWLGRALAEPPPPESRAAVLRELGCAELRLARPEAVDHLMAAIELTREPRLLADSVRLVANALTMSGRADRSVAAIESAVPVVEAEDPELGLLLEADLAAHAQQASLEIRAPAEQRLERHRDLTGTTRGERLVLATLAYQKARASESAGDAEAIIERALAGGRLLAEQELDVTGPFYLLMVGLLATDALQLADACLRQALAEARARASIPAVAFVIAHRGWVSMRRGAVAHGEADARTALELLTSHDIWLGTELALGVLIGALIERGKLHAAERALHDGGFDEKIPAGMASDPLLGARSMLRLAQGSTAEGLADLVEFGRRDELNGGANPLASRWRSYAAVALAARGDKEAARQMALDDLDRARRWGAASGIGVALRAGALVAGGPASVDLLREAVAVLAESPARLEHGRALTDLGAALRRANRRAEARGALQEGLTLAGQCGADELAKRARTELRAAGGRASNLDRTGVLRLTVSERRVAELAAEGRSNPEIAQALFVTRKTVETHLGSAYHKLDVSGRRELPRALARQSPQASP